MDQQPLAISGALHDPDGTHQSSSLLGYLKSADENKMHVYTYALVARVQQNLCLVGTGLAELMPWWYGFSRTYA